MAPIIAPPKKDNIGSDTYSKKDPSCHYLLCTRAGFYSHSIHEKKMFSGATNSSGFDLRALNSDVKRAFIVSCKLVKQTIH